MYSTLGGSKWHTFVQWVRTEAERSHAEQTQQAASKDISADKFLFKCSYLVFRIFCRSIKHELVQVEVQWVTNVFRIVVDLLMSLPNETK